MTVQAPAAPNPADNSPLGTVMAMAVKGALSIADLFSAAAVLQESGQLPAAIALYHAWIEHTPSPLTYAACFNLAVMLSQSGDDAAAEAVLRKAMALNPNFIEARLNLGTLLERNNRPDEALAMWESILAPGIEPDIKTNPTLYVQTLNNLGRLLEIRKRYPEAEAMLARSLHVDPQQSHVMTHWVHLRQKQCNWPVYSGLEHISVATMMEGTSALAMLSASADPAQQLAAARRFVHEKVNAAVAPLTGAHGYGHSRLRIGYLSSDFCSHAVSILTAELYELHDRNKFEVYAFSWSREDGSPIRARVVKAMDHYIRIDALTDEQAARTIRAHEIDILVDLHGLTLGARPNILAYRPAPVQLTYLGFPGSTALPGVDYVLADEFLITPEMAEHFTEKPLYLDCFQINDRQRAIAPKPTRASVNLPEDAFVFCSFNNNFKFTPDLFAVWMNILRRVPNSVLWLVADYPEVRENLWRHAEQAGIDRKRILFNTRAVPAEYLARYQLADLFLDTFPFNAGTTASDALWAGLPLLTCAGQTFSSRMAGSLLRAVDLPQLITYNFADYEEKAVALANDPQRIAAMKRQLTANRLTCALFDSPRFVRNLEQVLQQVAKPAAPRLAAPQHAVHPSEQAQAEPVRIDQIPVVTVSYNSPDLIEALLRTFRQFYSNRVYVIDGSNPDVAEQIRAITDRHDNVEFIPFGYNIHHGPGLAWAINHLGLSGEVLFLDSDVEIIQGGFLESLHSALRPGMYGVGSIQPVNEAGYDRADGNVRYLHPACMLTNIEVVRQWPMPIKHGAPMIAAMLAIHQAGQHQLIDSLDWVKEDFAPKPPKRNYIKHDWQGTVIRTGGYHYDLPSATSTVNTDLLQFVPLEARKVVEVHCRDGAFAKAYKARNAIVNYTGIEADPAPAQAARLHCDFVFNADIEHGGSDLWDHVRGADCWIMDEALEQLNDPWEVLRKIRTSIAPGGKLVITIRNFQHWSIQARLNAGDLRYGGALEKSRKRVFTRGALLELLQQSGFQISGGSARITDEPAREKYLPAIRLMAGASGVDPVVAVEDALPWQYIVTAVAA
ncbi:O-linked N-acetylglucosamine transferase family protein [Duganella radicis]|uniref:protein O-GlcNAc transferase n=1 Tax=Duganella radicis TaxID=551988 RepID=A0A6L6PMV3_9BURK|nr:methyltransferase domain-containing protein [Duganella radicis]MTV39971.1 methyltransferase domain-containing protein [Duganella radicis]